ncbi:hypothetical protein CCMA1212_005445 [Trichoderma ghanense]|uniref:Uncharacterized protein n=1 Tax=Trichoderma ghanense TaxID=65468 RepID=A0ABY2H341_9HYPO
MREQSREIQRREARQQKGYNSDVPAFRFYHEQQLFGFDTVVLVHDATLTTVGYALVMLRYMNVELTNHPRQGDIWVLQMCSLAQQVRTRAYAHIKNYAADFECKLEEARERHIAKARRDIVESQTESRKGGRSTESRFESILSLPQESGEPLREAASSNDTAIANIDEWDFASALSVRREAPVTTAG